MVDWIDLMALLRLAVTNLSPGWWDVRKPVWPRFHSRTTFSDVVRLISLVRSDVRFSAS